MGNNKFYVGITRQKFLKINKLECFFLLSKLFIINSWNIITTGKSDFIISSSVLGTKLIQLVFHKEKKRKNKSIYLQMIKNCKHYICVNKKKPKINYLNLLTNWTFKKCQIIVNLRRKKNNLNMRALWTPSLKFVKYKQRTDKVHVDIDLAFFFSKIFQSTFF